MGAGLRMGRLLDHLRFVTIDASRRHVTVPGYPAGAAAELLDGTLKLRYCTTVFTNRFAFPWVLPGFGKGIGKRCAVTSDSLLDCRSNFGKRVPLTRKSRPGIPVYADCFPLGPQDPGEEEGVPRYLSPRLGAW